MKSLLLSSCSFCNLRFEAEGSRLEWHSALFGPCHEYQAPCPDCCRPAKEHRVHSSKKPSTPCESGPCAETGSCGGGLCGMGGLGG